MGRADFFSPGDWKHCHGCATSKLVAEFHRRGSNGYQTQCKACQKKYAAAKYVENKKVIDARNVQWRENNKESLARAARARYLADPEAAHARTRKWRERNKAHDACRRASRKAAVGRATPNWADMRLVKDAYEEARYHGLHVDHIVPIRSPLVCGLHVWENLQLISARENHSKRNCWWPGMPNG